VALGHGLAQQGQGQLCFARACGGLDLVELIGVADAGHPTGQAVGQLGGGVLDLADVRGHVGRYVKAVSQKVQHALALVGGQCVGCKALADGVAQLVDPSGIDNALRRVADDGTLHAKVGQHQQGTHKDLWQIAVVHALQKT